MMDCKNALVEANGDFEAAVDVLRKKGQKIAAKKEEICKGRSNYRAVNK